MKVERTILGTERHKWEAGREKWRRGKGRRGGDNAVRTFVVLQAI